MRRSYSKEIAEARSGAKKNAQQTEIGKDDPKVKRLQRPRSWAKECLTGSSHIFEYEKDPTAWRSLGAGAKQMHSQQR